MFIVSMKITKKKLAFLVVFAACITLAALFFFSGLRNPDPVTKPTGKTDAERIQYLGQFGWKLSPEPIEVKDVAIPQEFDKVYVPYNKLQLSQGFDLTPYKGKKVVRYTYEVTNYPDDVKDVRANILVYDGKIIGGDICNVSLGGFMHGFNLEGTGMSFGQRIQSKPSD